MRNRLLSNLLQTRKLFYEHFKLRTNNVITYSQLKQVQKFSTKSDEFKNIENVETSSHNLPASFGSNYKVFDDKDAEIILDASEKEIINLEDLQLEEEYYNPYEGINLERGVNGVFEIDDLVPLLQRENAVNIFVAAVPPELSYVSYIVVVTGKSQKHMKGLAAFIRKVYKLKRCKTDLIPQIEGKDSKDWVALDLGNIALHIFSQPARMLYDLETLWSVGPDYDEKSKVSDVDIMEQYNTFLSDMNPIDDTDYIKNESTKKDYK
ncbi:PREDICTED: mitochondrial assembly of ribosomal large subunit protein 1 [Dufourea novaeangliae]|uniref:Mitochondrial assembly of ribosomal large subunit protein 1 n=1 Tax=Dufourea novaeangliae TaxID=178035 RepID=A0A154P4T0_DUFNO|nr:PREDICTED: mitochondrial assembly of ribosomal large subunit protein 1 [Dufourea novaeangliae]KZC06887.1 Mitochondrial assembly of ribosomal large subunit protein 1 [Dufourea novaeangliae]